MKKCLVIFMLIPFFLFSACAFPVSKTSTDKTDTTTREAEPTGTKAKPAREAEQKVNDSPGVDSTNSVDRANRKDRLSITLFYQDKDRYVIPVTRKIVKQEGIAKAALGGMIDSAPNREELQYFGLYPLFPAGTQVLGINIKDGTAMIDFNNKMLEYDDEVDERNIVASVVYALTEFKTIDNVKILVNGHTKEKLKYGTDISGLLSRENVLINSSKANRKEEAGKLDVYLFKRVNDNYTYVLPVSLESTELADDELTANIIGLLAEESTDERLYTEVPKGVRLLKSSVNGNVLTLDLSGEILNFGGTAREDGILKQLAYSMKQIGGIGKINLLTDGKAAELPEGSDISKGLDIPYTINDVIDGNTAE